MEKCMTEQERAQLERAVMALQLRAPWLGACLVKPRFLRFEADCKTAYASKTHIAVGRRLLEATAGKTGQLVFVLAHEARHYLDGDVFLFEEPRPLKSGLPFVHQVGNICADLMINESLIRDRLGIPPTEIPPLTFGGVVSNVGKTFFPAFAAVGRRYKRYTEPYVLETVVRRYWSDLRSDWIDFYEDVDSLFDPPDPSFQPQPDPSPSQPDPSPSQPGPSSPSQPRSQLSGDVRPDLSDSDVSDSEARIEHRGALAEAREIAAKSASPGAQSFVRAADKLLEPAIDWREKLLDFLLAHRAGKGGVEDWSRPVRSRLVMQGVYQPDETSPSIGGVCALIDVSGSMSNDELSRCFAELTGVAEQVCDADTRLTVACFDAQIGWSSEDFTGSGVTAQDVVEAARRSLVGGGGTVFEPAAEFAKSLSPEPEVTIWLTDGFPSSWPSRDAYPTGLNVWVITTKGLDVPVAKYPNHVVIHV